MSRVLEFEGVRDFNLEQIFTCGQCFRWEMESVLDNQKDASWIGIAGSRVARVSYDEEDRLLQVEELSGGTEFASDEDAEATRIFWWNYFDLDRDYASIKAVLSEGDPVMKAACDYGGGIRILKQEFWEALISFIISQNNNIPRIKKCINSVAETLGTRLDTNQCDTDKIWYSLPSPQTLAKAKESDLDCCKLGYRSKYLIEAARQFLEFGEEFQMPEAEACESDYYIEKLQEFSGVGPKVANCVGLFGLGLIDSFPIDVWMRRVMSEEYGIPENDARRMKKYALENFAPYGGIAQQYLFYKKLSEKSQ